MKKLLFLLLMLPAMIFAAPIDPNLAQQVAENFINAPEVDANGVIKKAPQKRKQMARAAKQITADQQFYVFNSQDSEGFVIIAADDVAHPILGYSHSENLDIDNMPDNLRWWLSEYDRQIRWAQDNNTEQSEEIAQEWQQSYTNRINAATPVVAPLIQTKWNQLAPYNNLCPIFDGNNRAATGCVATATAQIMNYWQHPIHGTGSVNYTTTTRGFQLSADFSNSYYDWNNMLEDYSTMQATTAQKNAVAKLMSDVGIACGMDYALDETGQSGSHNFYACRALRTYFDYDQSMEYIERNSHSDLSWFYVLVQQLDKNLPMLYRGTGEENGQPTGGHSFVCDGYDNSGSFHFNWGWSGLGDGYYLLSALMPSETGIGAVVGDYSYNQAAVLNIKPSTHSEGHSLQLWADIEVSDSELFYNQPFSVSATIANEGNVDFSGIIYVILANNEHMIYIDSITNHVIPAQDFRTRTYNNSGKINLPTGQYYIMLFYKDENGNFGQVGGDYYMNILPINYNYTFTLTPGKYVIVANRDKADDKNWYYMTSDLGTASNKRFQAVSTETENIDDIVVTELEDEYIWELEADGTNWKLKNGDQYVSWSSGNTTKFDATGKSLTFEVEENKIQAHFNDGTNERYLSLNATTGNNYFAFYSGTNQQINLYFLPYEEEEPPVIPQPESDRYVILAQRNATSNWFYMTSDLGTASNKRYQAVDAGTSTLSEVTTTNLEDKYYWEIEENKLKTGAQYSTWTSGNTANLDATGKELTIQKQSDGTYTFSFADGADTRYLALNATAGNDYFAYYKGTNQIYRLTLVKEGGNGSTVDIENVVIDHPTATKVLRDGQIFILRGDKTYTLQGQEVK